MPIEKEGMLELKGYISTQVGGLENRMGGLETELGGVKTELAGVELRLGRMEKDISANTERLVKMTNQHVEDMKLIKRLLLID